MQQPVLTQSDLIIEDLSSEDILVSSIALLRKSGPYANIGVPF